MRDMTFQILINDLSDQIYIHKILQKVMQMSYLWKVSVGSAARLWQ